ncbi:hypothetical protein Tco_1191799 [Tanacetum coccineum]
MLNAYLSIVLQHQVPSLPLKSPVYHEPSVASVVSASVVDRSIGTDNPHLSLGSQADSWYYFLGCLAEHPTFVGHSNLLIEIHAADNGKSKWIKDLALTECGVKCRESTRDVYSKPIIITVTKLEIVDWHNYKHLDWITVRRDDNKLYKFKEGDFNRLRIPPRHGFIYQNKDKKNKLMRIDELHKFSDGTLDDVGTALNDRLKRIRMEYLPKTIWRQSDRERAKAMIQAIDKQLKSRRIMRSLEKFIGGRPYEGDL